MIWDCFLFGTEDDLPMLECRLATLASTGVRHVLIESQRDFHGRPKPLWYAENAARFSQWNVTAAVAPLPGPGYGVTTWEREAMQREAVYRTLFSLGAHPDDRVMLSDVDEIPRPSFVGIAGRVLLMRHLVHSLQWQAPAPWRGTVCLKAGDMASVEDMRAMRWSLTGIPDAGWHLSWMGSPAAKLDTTSHTELPEMFKEGVRSGSCKRDGWHLDGDRLVQMVPAGPEDWPRWIRDGHAPEAWGAHQGAGERRWNGGTGTAGGVPEVTTGG